MITKNEIQKIFEAGSSTGADFVEVFVESTVSNSFTMKTNKVETALSGTDYGVGIRLFRGLDGVYGYTNNDSIENLVAVANKLAASFDDEARKEVYNFDDPNIDNAHKITKKPTDVNLNERLDILKRANKSAREYSEYVKQVTISLVDSVQDVIIANTEGTYVEDSRTHTRLAIAVVAEKDGVMETGFFGPGGHVGYEFFENNVTPEEAAKEAARIAIVMLDAEECPSGQMPVVIDNGFGGVIFHEACGHPLEATSVARGTSVFAGKLGTQIASPLVTAIDDGTIPNGWGSSNVDDEGTPTRRNVLIEKGILKSYMVDKLNARKMKTDITGSSRRQSYRFAPTSRMTNTFIDNGESTLEEIIAATEYGLYAKKMGGGSVVPATGDFNFSVNEGYLIENGKITKPVKGASLVGNGADILLKIDMIANNLERAQGMCGSLSGTIPADVGQPALRVSSITVGGRKGAK